jgi:hypothetical protein
MEMKVAEDCERIVRVCGERGSTITVEEARQSWRAHSDSLAARWMLLPHDNDRLFSEVALYLPGERYARGARRCSKCHGGEALPEMAFCLICTRETLSWLRRVLHEAHHSGPLDECKQNTCDVTLKALGLRSGKVIRVEPV